MQRELLKVVQRLLRTELRRRGRRRIRGVAGVAVILVLAVIVYGVDQWLTEPRMPAPDPGSDLTCALRSVQDGDTITVRCDEGVLRVRIWGIDAPETEQAPWGDIATEHFKNLLGNAREVQVQVVDIDRYGRTVARIFLNDRDLGLVMVRDGQAIVYESFNNSPVYYEAQEQAQQARLGIWSQPGDHQDPPAWRRMNR